MGANCMRRTRAVQVLVLRLGPGRGRRKKTMSRLSMVHREASPLPGEGGGSVVKVEVSMVTAEFCQRRIL